MSGPLDGYRVIDLTTMISGPVCTMILGDQGADVIKVEALNGGDHVRRAGYAAGPLTTSFLNNNRSKRSITLDLKSERGRQILLDLAKTADVMVQNFRPGVVDRLGVGYTNVQEVNPEIVYLSISGFGEQGPYASKPVYDPIIQALSGLATIQAGSDTLRPRLIRTILPDKLTGVSAAQAVTAALLSRAKTGKGQHVKLSMLDAILAFLWSSDMGAQTLVDKEISIQRAATFIDLIYETKEGYISVSAMADKQWMALCNTIGHPEWIEDKRFKTAAGRDKNANERLELTQSALLEKTAEEWLTLLEAAGVPSAPVLTRNEMVSHPQVLASDILTEYQHPHAGRLRQARPAARFELTPPEATRGAPLLGEHTDELLTEIGLSQEQIEVLKNDGVV